MDRLIASFEIDDGEADLRQCDTAGDVEPFAVGSPMADGSDHPI